MILVDYGDEQFILRIQDKRNFVTYTPLDSSSFQSVSAFQTNTQNLLKIHPLLNQTDLYEM